MIISLILRGLVALAEGLLSVIPGVDLPEWLSDIPDRAGSMGEAAAPFGVWLPLTLVSNLAAGMFALYAGLLVVRGARRVLSLFTGGGG